MKSFLSILPHLIHAVSAHSSQEPLYSSTDEYGPNIASATTNANLIFNSIHSSMRQWGNSIHHNGMSFYPSYIPTNTLLYHGNGSSEIPTNPEWLAFEILHAENFALTIKPKKPNDDYVVNADGFLDTRSINPSRLLGMREPEFEFIPGYLHVYQANRPLKVLYIDGMSAGNSPRGTLDSQDLLLLNFSGTLWEERKRADELCKLAGEWGIDGFIRMECGSEVIKCDFRTGLERLSVRKVPDKKTKEGRSELLIFEFVRDIGSRYGGIGGGRVVSDFSNMVSALFYPANLTNEDPDPRQAKLPRLVDSSDEVLKRIKSDLGRAVRASTSDGSVGVNWQGVADMIVSRYAGKLKFLATGLGRRNLLSEVNMLMNAFIDYDAKGEEQDVVEVCAGHFLLAVKSRTEQDWLIEAAFRRVMLRICETIDGIRHGLLEKEEASGSADGGEDNTGTEVQSIRDLVEWLDWTDWISCGTCAVDEVCFIAVFPFGTEEDHYNPRCQNSSQFDFVPGSEDNYWFDVNGPF